MKMNLGKAFDRNFEGRVSRDRRETEGESRGEGTRTHYIYVRNFKEHNYGLFFLKKHMF